MSIDTAARIRPINEPPQYKIASTREELQAAFRLVYQAYLRNGLILPNRYGMRVTPYHLLPTTEVFVCVYQGDVICTLSLIRDGEMGLPMETIYDYEVALRRNQGIQLAEVSCLADRRKDLERSLPVVVRIMSLMAQCATRRGVDQLMIAVHPRHAEFYQRFIGFKMVGETKSYQTVCDNPAVALALDLNRLHVDHPRAYKRFFGQPFPEAKLRYQAISDELYAELRGIAQASDSSEQLVGAGSRWDEGELLGARG